MNPLHRSLVRSFFPLILGLWSLFIPKSTHAQWQWNGTPVVPPGTDVSITYDITADQDEGLWFVGEVYPQGLQKNIWLQHLDEGGVALLSPTGIPITTEPERYYQEVIGMVPSGDGGVVILFRNLGGDLPGGSSVYAQRFSPDNEMMWGDTGIPVIRFDDDQFGNLGVKSYASDGAGGAWVLSDRVSNENIYVQGINTDGTLKLESPLLLGQGELSACSVEPDGEGGVFICWRQDIHPGYRTYYQHVDSAGVALFPLESVILEPYIVVNTLAPDPWGGAYWLGHDSPSHGASNNRIRHDGSLLYDSLHNIRYAENMATSNPVVMANGDVVWYAAGSRRTHLVRLDTSGTSFYETDTVSVENHNGEFSGGTFVRLQTDQSRENVILMIRFYYMENDTAMMRIGAQKINVDAIDEWDIKTLYDYRSVFEYQPYIAKSILSSEGDYFFAGVINDLIESRYIPTVFKVFANGRVAGRDTLNVGVPEAGGRPPVVSSFSLSVSPNPFNASTNISISSPVPGEVDIRVVDILGRTVHSARQHVQIGVSPFNWTPDPALSSGIFFVTVQFNGKRLDSTTCKIVMMK